MKKLTALFATLLVSTTASAGIETIYQSKNVTTDAFNSKSEAYEAGFDYLDQLNNMSKYQLRRELAPVYQTNVQHLKLDSSQVSVEEFAFSKAQIAYRAVVKIGYHFDAYESNDH